MLSTEYPIEQSPPILAEEARHKAETANQDAVLESVRNRELLAWKRVAALGRFASQNNLTSRLVLRSILEGGFLGSDDPAKKDLMKSAAYRLIQSDKVAGPELLESIVGGIEEIEGLTDEDVVMIRGIIQQNLKKSRASGRRQVDTQNDPLTALACSDQDTVLSILPSLLKKGGDRVLKNGSLSPAAGIAIDLLMSRFREDDAFLQRVIDMLLQLDPEATYSIEVAELLGKQITPDQDAKFEANGHNDDAPGGKKGDSIWRKMLATARDDDSASSEAIRSIAERVLGRAVQDASAAVADGGFNEMMDLVGDEHQMMGLTPRADANSLSPNLKTEDTDELLTSIEVDRRPIPLMQCFTELVESDFYSLDINTAAAAANKMIAILTYLATRFFDQEDVQRFLIDTRAKRGRFSLFHSLLQLPYDERFKRPKKIVKAD